MLAELGHSQIQNRPLFTQNLMGSADREPTSEWCRFPQTGTSQGVRPQLLAPAGADSCCDFPATGAALKETRCRLESERGRQLTRPYFRRLRELRDQLATRHLPGLSLDVLSMGMSHDFEVAIEEGSTCVRVGSAIFGERTKP